MNYATHIKFGTPEWFARHAEHVIALDNARFDAEARKGELPDTSWSAIRRMPDFTTLGVK
jgi:hypothetical protein